VLTNDGLSQVIVDTSSNLVLVAPGGQRTTLFNGTVQTAQGFRATNGALGVDVVFLDGSAIHYDPAAGGVMNFSSTFFDGNILDFATAYSASGQVRIDILVANPVTGPFVVTSLGITPAGVALGRPTISSTFGGLTGHVLEFTPSTGLRDLGLGTNVRWLDTYQDTAGGTGIAVGQELPNNELLVRKADAVTGVTTLYDGLDYTSAAITGYSQTVSFSSPNNPTVVIDVTYNSSTNFSLELLTQPPQTLFGTYALEFTYGPANFPGSTGPGVKLVGNGGDIKPGGLSLVAVPL
jgi:hypothetical protein